MKNLKFNFFLAIIFILLTFNNSDLFSQLNEEPIVIGKRIQIDSKTLKEKRLIQIFLPESYSDSTKKYPVLYVLDGNNNSPTASIIVKSKSRYNAHFPEMIIVGINNVNRSRDYSFPDGADKIMNFISDELIPFIDSTYRTENFRILFGHSATGSFCLYSLPKAKDLFNAYIILSPAIAHETEYIVKYNLRKFITETDKLDKKMYIGFADNDRYENDVFKASYMYLDSLFNSVSIKMLKMKLDILDREDHWSENLIGMYKGLDFIFYSWRVPMETMIKGDIIQLRKHIDSLTTIYGHKHKYPEEILSFYGNEGYLQGHTEGLFTNKEPLFESAIEIFKINIENYPNSSSAYFDLGNAYLLKGDKKEAKVNFIKALEINPENKRAKDILKKIEGE